MLLHKTQSLILVCSERKKVIGMRKFWPRPRLQVWKMAGILSIVKTKKLKTVYMLSQVSRQQFQVTDGKLVYCFREETIFFGQN